MVQQLNRQQQVVTVSNQLISLASRESNSVKICCTVSVLVVSNQLISLASRELGDLLQLVHSLGRVSNQLISLASRESFCFSSCFCFSSVSNQLISLASRE